MKANGKSTEVATKRTRSQKKVDDEVEKDPPAASKNGRAKRSAPQKSPEKASNKESSDDSLDEVVPTKKSRAMAPIKTGFEPKTNGKPAKTLMNSAATEYKDIDFGSTEKFNFKIATWNVAGLRALVKKNSKYFAHEDADIICLNEVKCGNEKEIPDEVKLKGYHAYWNIAKGAPGVGILSKVKPISVTHDLPKSPFSDEKRLITAEYENFYLVAVYVVNAGRGLKTLDKRLEFNDVFDEHVKGLDAIKPVIIAGDLNVSHQEIDLANPKTNHKTSGFTPQERAGFTKLLSYGFVDTFRHFKPDETGAYTYWTYLGNARSRNVGWRLDYFAVSKRFMTHVKDNVIRSSVMGSDHCPIVLFLDL